MYANHIAAQQTATARAKQDGGDLYEVSFTLKGKSGKQTFVNDFDVRRFKFDIEFNGGEITKVIKLR